MRVKAKRILSCVCFLCLLLLCFIKTADILEAKVSRVKYTSFFESDTNFDVIFLGSSHIYNGILPQELWNEYGITSYNWGYSNSTPAEGYYLLKEIVKYTDPKLVVIDLYGLVEYENKGNGKYRSDRIEQRHVQFDMFPFSINKLKATLDLFDDYEYKSDFLFDFLLYHTRWDDLSEDDFRIEYSTEKGARLLAGYEFASINFISENEQTEIHSVCSEYIQPTIEFCNENDIELLFVYLPYGSTEDTQRVANSFGDFAASFGDFQYLNLIYSDSVNYNTDLYTDQRHLNYMGAYKITSELGAYIQQEYDLTDYREDDDYSSWWSDYSDYLLYKTDTLKNQDSIYNILIMAYSDEYSVNASVREESFIENNLFLHDYFHEKADAAITCGADSDALSRGETEYQMILQICEKETGEELMSAGVKNSSLDFDVLN